MEEIKAYRCTDNEVFTEKDDAARHEAELEIRDYLGDEYAKQAAQTAENVVRFGKYLLVKLTELDSSGLLLDIAGGDDEA